MPVPLQWSAGSPAVKAFWGPKSPSHHIESHLQFPAHAHYAQLRSGANTLHKLCSLPRMNTTGAMERMSNAERSQFLRFVWGKLLWQFLSRYAKMVSVRDAHAITNDSSKVGLDYRSLSKSSAPKSSQSRCIEIEC